MLLLKHKYTFLQSSKIILRVLPPLYRRVFCAFIYTCCSVPAVLCLPVLWMSNRWVSANLRLLVNVKVVWEQLVDVRMRQRRWNGSLALRHEEAYKERSDRARPLSVWAVGASRTNTARQQPCDHTSNLTLPRTHSPHLYESLRIKAIRAAAQRVSRITGIVFKLVVAIYAFYELPWFTKAIMCNNSS